MHLQKLGSANPPASCALKMENYFPPGHYSPVVARNIPPKSTARLIRPWSGQTPWLSVTNRALKSVTPSEMLCDIGGLHTGGSAPCLKSPWYDSLVNCCWPGPGRGGRHKKWRREESFCPTLTGNVRKSKVVVCLAAWEQCGGSGVVVCVWARLGCGVCSNMLQFISISWILLSSDERSKSVVWAATT